MRDHAAADADAAGMAAAVAGALPALRQARSTQLDFARCGLVDVDAAGAEDGGGAAAGAAPAQDTFTAVVDVLCMPAQSEAITEAGPGCWDVRTLDLSANSLTGTSPAMTKLLASNDCAIQRINLADNPLTTGITLAAGLNRSHLSWLSLNRCALSPQSTASLIGQLAENETLETLILSYNHVGCHHRHRCVRAHPPSASTAACLQHAAARAHPNSQSLTPLPAPPMPLPPSRHTHTRARAHTHSKLRGGGERRKREACDARAARSLRCMRLRVGILCRRRSAMMAPRRWAGRWVLMTCWKASSSRAAVSANAAP